MGPAWRGGVAIACAAAALATGAPAVAAPAGRSPFLVPYPRAKLSARKRRLVAAPLIAKPLSLAAGETRQLAFRLPPGAKGNPDAFVTVTARVRTAAAQERLVTLGDGLEVCAAAPVAPSPDWQSVTTVFAFPITQRALTVALTATAPVEIGAVQGVTTFDDRYVREVCSKRTVRIGGRPEQRYDYHERMTYRKAPGQTRIVVVGNSTIDGCGARRGARSCCNSSSTPCSPDGSK